MQLISREIFEWAVELEEGVNVSAGSGTSIDRLSSRPEGGTPVEAPAVNGGFTERPETASPNVGRLTNRPRKLPVHGPS